MGKKQFWCVVDTETTMEDTVADFAAIIVDRHGKIFASCAVLVKNHYGTFELFHDKKANDIWGYEGLLMRKANYVNMLNSGTRMLASAKAINRWLNQAVGKYDPILTAYNLAFDKSKCSNTEIDLGIFSDRFCLWQAAVGSITYTKKYRQFCLDNHLFNAPTEKGNMTYKTKAENVYCFLTGDNTPEPHTALEDARDFEIPILIRILAKRDWKEKMIAYDWNKHQVRDHFVAK
jgi:hypothetical protein